jgi:hypothetical protein
MALVFHRAQLHLLARIFASCALLSCMPLGNAPEGQHLVHDRSLASVFFSPSGSDSLPPHLLVLGPSRLTQLPGSAFLPSYQTTVVDLYHIPYGDSAGPASRLDERVPSVSNVGLDSMNTIMASGILSPGVPAMDSMGRLFFSVDSGDQSPSGQESWTIERYDPGSGALEAIALNDNPYPANLVFSPGRTRAFYQSSQGLYTLIELDGESAIDARGPMAFIGEDLYYLTSVQGSPASLPESRVYRRKPHSEPELLLRSATSYFHFDIIQGDRAPQLLLSLGFDRLAPPVLLDTETLAASSLPSDFGGAELSSSSSNGHWLLFQLVSLSTDPLQPLTRRQLLFNWTTGITVDLNTSQVDQGYTLVTDGYMFAINWRPGHEELWLSSVSSASNIAIWKPDGPPSLVQANVRFLSSTSGDPASLFTPNGLHWFANGSGLQPSVYAGWADDPTVPPVRLTPEGTSSYWYWPLDGDELLLTTYTNDAERQDLYRVNLATGVSRALAGGGNVVAVGKTRILALLEWDSSLSSGDLTLVDLESGERKVLAENVTKAVVAPAASSSGGDPLAPGTRVAFVYRNRLASPYDGLWVTELP